MTVTFEYFEFIVRDLRYKRKKKKNYIESMISLDDQAIEVPVKEGRVIKAKDDKKKESTRKRRIQRKLTVDELFTDNGFKKLKKDIGMIAFQGKNKEVYSPRFAMKEERTYIV